ncbi:MAG: hypothetical protein AAF790_10045 [Planctomycetota bacterium]
MADVVSAQSVAPRTDALSAAEPVAAEQPLGRYGLRLEPAAGRSPRVVVSVHGFNAGRESAERLLGPARGAGLRCGTFAYPNDQPLEKSAELLSEELRRLRLRWPAARVALVTHSMGGLVARACVEDDRLAQGNVSHLIMVAPPTHGSRLAPYAVGTDLWEHWLCRRTGGPYARIRDAIADGLGEAADDLTPGSPFLQRLNARGRNPAVAYTLILGAGGGVTDEQLRWARKRMRRALAGIGARSTAERLDRCLADMDEFVTGRGDGVVAVKRARLAGVDDVVVLPFGHLSVLRGADAGAASRPAPTAADVILQRLRSPAPAGLPKSSAAAKD